MHRFLYAYANPLVYVDLHGNANVAVQPGTMGPAGFIPGAAQAHWQSDYDGNGQTVGQEAFAPVVEFVEGAWSGAKNLAGMAAKKWVEFNFLPFITTEDSGPTTLTTPIHQNEPTVLTTPIQENEPTILTTPAQETGPTTYTTPIQENGPTVYVTPDQSDLIDSGPYLSEMNPHDLRFSQRSAGGNGRAAKLREQMKEGWDPSKGAVDVIQTEKGLVSFDNTRVGVAQEYDLPSITVTIHELDEALPEGFAQERALIERAEKLGLPEPTTWGDALRVRTKSNRLPLEGTRQRPRMPR